MKIINADKLHYKQVYIQTEKGLRPALVVFAKEIRKMPEIVRCRDCKWRNQESANCERFRKDWYVQADSFCSWGERREDGKTD